MKCLRCQQENPAGARFCIECATPLARACANCGTWLPAAAKFCPECAHPTRSGEPGPTAPRFCHLGLGKLYQRTGKREQAEEHLTTATTMYREMGMTY